MNRSSSPRVATVVGAGIVGWSCALSLQERGIDVTVLDRLTSNPPASFGNIGHIALEQGEPLASWAMLRQLPRRLALFGGVVDFPLAALPQWLPFGLRLMAAASPRRFAAGKAALSTLLTLALPAWRRHAERLGQPQLLRETGHWVAHERPANRSANAPTPSAEVGGAPFSVTAADPALLQRLQSCVQVPIAGLDVYRGTASVADPGEVLARSRQLFEARGGRVLQGVADRAWLQAPPPGLVVVAAGVQSGELVQGIGLRAPIIAERGYHLQFAPGGWPEDVPPVVFEDRSLVVNRFNSGLRITSFLEFNRHDAPPDPRKWEHLEAQARALGLPMQQPWKRWHGSRPTLPDYLPAIGRSPRNERLLYAFGHQHLGLTLGPITGELIAALAVGEPPAMDLGAFSLGRFANRP